MSEQNIKSVGIIGSGTMGSGIAELTAAKGFKVELIDVSTEIVNSGYSNIEKSIKRQEARKRITPEESTEILSRINASDSFDNLWAVKL